MNDDERLLQALELDALRRQVELEELRKIRLEARVAGRTDEVVVWVESADEEDDNEQLEALRRFRPQAWWGDE